MRILFVTNNYTPYSGGIVSSIDATVHALYAKGHDVLLVTLDFFGVAVSEHKYIVRIPTIFRFMYKSNHMAIPWRATYELLSLAQTYSPDIIHVHHPFLLGKSGLDVAHILGIPCVFTYHTLYEQYAHYVPVPSLCSKPIIRWLVKCFCKEVDGIVVPSSGVKNYLRTQKIISPVEVIPSALRPAFLLHYNEHMLQKEKRFFELLFVSRFTQEKNVAFVLNVFKLLPDCVRLTLVGYGAEYNNLQNLAFNIFQFPQERVRFIHKPEQTVLLNVYRCADLFIFPSQSDTQGLVIAEAMSQGLPVVALDGPGQRDIIRNGENGFIVTDDKAAAMAVKHIIMNNDLHKQLKIGARATVERYQPAVQASQLLDFYDTIRLF